MAKNDHHDNVYAIGTGELLRKSFKRSELLPQQLEIINMLNQRKNQMKDIIFIWTERDDDPDPKFITTTMSCIQRAGLLAYVTGVINSLEYDDASDDDKDEEPA